ncbi:MAG TPA: 3-hydroxyacyl-CoA dehydrogenase NAD-binding domain-containing protein, partial [Terracidiphilus sp.]|nr:3-hydroxyacyl-CoA dehydrogenase NAD-binding domain-containing protein [Terracidiphilus sp.]
MTPATTATIPAPAAPARPLLVRRAAVLGAGTMGVRIAAHLANAGIPSVLLDLPPKSETAEPLAKAALAGLRGAKPAAFFEPELARMVTPGDFDRDLPALKDCDWVIEAVAENLEIKTALLKRVTPHLAKHAILTTNTSGLPVKQIGAALGSHRERFFGAHFFNPPRYMRLLEVISTGETDTEVVAAFAVFA